MKYNKCIRYILAVGTNDAKTYEPIFTLEEAREIVVERCRFYKVSFSIGVVTGSYINKEGKYIEEKSVIVTIIDPSSEKIIENIAKDLCTLLHQECVSVTVDEVERTYISSKD